MRWLMLAAAALLAACASPAGPPPSPGDCTTIRLWSNGFHANLALRAEVLGEAHALRNLFPEAEYFLVGWGERDFYMAEEGGGFWQGLKAIIPPSPSVIHVIAGDAPVEETLWRPKDLAEFAISETGAARMAEAIANAIARDEDGAPIILAQGRIPGASYFLAARGNFHLFNMCNHWTARRLREAGVPVTPAVSFTAGGLVDAVRRKAPEACPPDE